MSLSCGPCCSRRTKLGMQKLLGALLRVGPLKVEPRPHSLARLEVNVRLGLGHHGLARTRVPGSASIAIADAERTEVAQLNAIAVRQSQGDPVKDDTNHRLDILRVEVGVLLGDAGDQL